MSSVLRPPEPQPVIEINTTPLIDVLLVLLIMFIITIPMQTHAVKLDLPHSCARCPRPDPHKNVIEITRSDAILWNSRALAENTLRSNLEATQQMSPVPELHLRPAADARYEMVDRVLGIIKKQRIEKFGFVGNEAYSNW